MLSQFQHDPLNQQRRRLQTKKSKLLEKKEKRTSLARRWQRKQSEVRRYEETEEQTEMVSRPCIFRKTSSPAATESDDCQIHLLFTFQKGVPVFLLLDWQ